MDGAYIVDASYNFGGVQRSFRVKRGQKLVNMIRMVTVKDLILGFWMVFTYLFKHLKQG